MNKLNVSFLFSFSQFFVCDTCFGKLDFPLLLSQFSGTSEKHATNSNADYGTLTCPSQNPGEQ